MYLGLDLGTSELKALLLADDHRVVALARAPLAVQRPQPLWSEQAPADWWAAVESVMGELAATHAAALAQVRAIGLSGQMHGAVLLDEAGSVLRPAILWNDGRSGAACAALTAAVPALPQITGNLAMPGFTAPKLWWVREHEPDVFARTACVLLPKDFVRLQLTGEAVTDCSDASGTLWLDVGARRWSAELLAACGLSEAHMPRLVEGSAVSARLRPALARRWGLPADVPVAGGGGDNAASAVGIGAVSPGQGFVSLGTSGVIFRTTDRFAPNPAQALHAFCHAVPGRWHQMSVMLSAASALGWAARAFGFADEAQLLQAAESFGGAERGAQREAAPLFLPYLSGERSPHNDPLAQGAFIGLTHSHAGAALAYAVVEGVSFGLLDGYRSFGPVSEGVRSASTSPPASEPTSGQALSLVGGGSRSAFWAQLLADVLGVPLTTHTGGEAGGALGAARLAWLADGGSEAEVCTAPPVARGFEPDAAAHVALALRAERFRRLYPALRETSRS
ncbi:MAG: xylulose kinase [Methylibium sp. NZG]|nr:MAG: xylulose kinase [Methylibium sp. NZG]